MPAAQEPAAGRPRRGMAEKRQAITRAARTVFARDGFSRASVDAIAAEAGVSKRTIYNHFQDKEELFRSVVIESAGSVTAWHRTMVERHLGKITDLERDLTSFAFDWASPPPEFADHFALVRQIHAEASHLEPAVIEAWQEAGPRPAFRQLAHRLGELAEEGLLDIDDAGVAARHFALLAVSDVSQGSLFGAVKMPETEVDTIVSGGVRAFLRLYGPPGTARRTP
ncbi:TetR/AcrR family transcriptional regulator [Streptomyces albireticuli]|nr:TetR/AcrR family transcriptional regulator [Streptomyces albireticuli]MCD9144050.1 TetR/AcrR family transcriptional regulator [Streptomyces albireticuli]MCD9162307.1 TetR/AcrR family transcriptional regulator [Streptomyces albireticuli]MCD9195524.1 TetR/AcrR family transcriptional regulator [Streptomyces albireticuli]